MKEEYGFLCVGQAASNIGVQFERLGYNVLYVNTSSEDLNLLKDSSHKYHVEGGEGCAKDRDKAKALLANDIDTLVDLVRTKLPERLIFVVFASGGGTGSGLSPYLLGVLVEEFGADEYDPEKRFAAVTILPTDKEPLQPAINSYHVRAIQVEAAGILPQVTELQRHDLLKLNNVNYAMSRDVDKKMLLAYRQTIYDTLSSGLPYREILTDTITIDDKEYHTMKMTKQEWDYLCSAYRNYNSRLVLDESGNLNLLVG